MKNLLIVLSGPSGVGKGTVLKELLKSGGFALSVSCTTRKMRDGEKEGKSYFFVSKEQFLKNVEEGGLLEYSEHFGNFYGTPKRFVEEKLKTCNVVLEIEVDGALQVKKSYPQAVLIMLLPPDMKTLRARLSGRGTESGEEIERRVKRAEYELSKKDMYDYSVVNGKIKDCVEQLKNIIKKEKDKKE